MKIKPEPNQELHRRRKEEIQIIFKNVPDKKFSNALELGAGDGFQSVLLHKYAHNLICTEYVKDRLPNKNEDGIEYQVADAQNLNQHFKDKKFDLVFSSNMMEHLPKPSLFLQGVNTILNEGAISIHSMPNQFWKISHMLLHHFNYVILLIELLTGSRKNSSQKMLEHEQSYDNHDGVKRYSRLRKILWPIPHGVSKNNIQEFFAFGKKRWIMLFRKNGFEIVEIKKGPISSGYSLGFRRTRNLFKSLGLCSEYIYIIKRKNENCLYEQYFREN